MARDRDRRPSPTASAQGFGESRIFNDESLADEVKMATAECTLNGQPIPSNVIHLIPWQMTDQGVAENDAKGGPRARVISDEFDRVQEYNERVAEPWMAVDAVGELAKKHLAPGFRGRMLSPSAVERKGLRGWEPVKKENGDPVKLGRMILGQMPEGAARRRNQHYREEGFDAIRQKQEEIKEGLDRIAFEGGAGQELGSLRDGDTMYDSRSGEQIEIGRQATRGYSAQEELVTS